MLAKLNQLNQVKSSVLSNWLQKHSIPHKSKGRKAQLILKVTEHIKKRKTQLECTE